MEDHADDLIGSLGECPVMSPSEERELFRRVGRGDACAREEAIMRNMRLVISIAKGYRGRGLPFVDLIHEGTLGLIRAVDKFDPTLGNKFSTYATWWVRQAVQRAPIRHGTSVRLPLHVASRRIMAARELARNPGATEEDLARAAGCSVRHLRDALSAQDDAVSIDSPSADGGSARHEQIADPDADCPEELAIGLLPTGALRRAIAELPEDEGVLISLRFGIGGGAPLSFNEAAAEMGCTAARAQGLQRTALEKLRRRFDAAR